MCKLAKAVSLMIFACWPAFYSGAALAYTPQWLECTGDLTVTPVGGAGTKEAAKDVYVFDPDANNLFKYSETRKALSFLGAKPGKTEMDLQWAASSSGIGATSWEGHFDRTTMTLGVTYKGDQNTRTWTQKCVPTAPLPES